MHVYIYIYICIAELSFTKSRFQTFSLDEMPQPTLNFSRWLRASLITHKEKFINQTSLHVRFLYRKMRDLCALFARKRHARRDAAQFREASIAAPPEFLHRSGVHAPESLAPPGIMESQLRAKLKPPAHHRTMLPGGLREALIWAPFMQM